MIPRFASIIAAVFAGGFLTVATMAETIAFNDLKPGTPPAGWLATKTGFGSPKWTIEQDAGAPGGRGVLKQSGRADYPLCLKNETKLKNGFVEVKFKSISGRETQVGAVVWRAQNAKNYFVARADTLEGNVHLYRTMGGNCVQFDGVDLKAITGEWHVLRVEFVGPKFTVFFDGQEVLTAKDNDLAEAGLIGVGTKDDAVTLFDDFSYGAR